MSQFVNCLRLQLECVAEFSAVVGVKRPRLMAIIQKFKTLKTVPATFLMYFMVAWFCLGLSRLFINLFSFKTLAAKLGVQDGAYPRTPLCPTDVERKVATIGKAIRTAARYTPWNSNCFPQALTARVMLGAIDAPYAMFFGVRGGTPPKKFEAHAWVVSGRVRVTGGRSFGRFSTVACFASESSLAENSALLSRQNAPQNLK